MVAFLFAYLFYLIEFIHPDSFYLISRTPTTFSYAEYLSELIYFSYITLLTVGFGDITPIKNLSQTFVVIEGIIGQFYIAILVARIVSIYALFSDKRLIKTIEHDIGVMKKKKKRRSGNLPSQ
jgi:voltage-gated potassium channel Kch